MTEYDYSPEAYERYIKTQERISQWVSQTKAHERRYANPFVRTEISDSQTSSSASREPSPHHRSKPNGSPMYIVTDTPKRSKTLDSNKGRSGGAVSPGESSIRPSRSRSFTNTSIDTRSKPRSRSHGPSPSHGAYQVVATPYPYPQATPQHSYPMQHQHQQQHQQHHSSRPFQPPKPVRSASTPPVRYYNARPGGPIQIPAPRPGEHFVIIPPHSNGDDRSSRTRRVELVSTKGNVPYPNAMPPPRKDSGGPFAKEPLLKRLLGSIIFNGGGGGGGLHRRDTTGSQRRTRRRSTY